MEGHGGVQNLPWGDAEHLRVVRAMLVQESADGLCLARAFPRAGLNHGKRIEVDRLPTQFGKIGCTIESDLLHQQITARISPPERGDAAIHLPLRHPGKAKIRSVLVNDASLTNFEGEWILLPAGRTPLSVRVVFERSFLTDSTPSPPSSRFHHES